MQLTRRHTNLRVSGLSAVSVLSLALVVWPADGRAQTAAEVRSKLQDSIARREKARATLESNRKYLNENRERVGTLKDEMARLDKERARTNADLIRTGEKVQQTEAKMTVIESRLEKFEEQENRLRRSLNAQHRSISGLLSAIQRMGRNPPPVMITRRADALKMVRSAMLLAHAFPELRGKALALSRQLNRLVALMSGIRQESDKLRAESNTLRDAQTRLSLLMKTKRKSLGDRTVELAEVNRTVKVIGRNVQSLEGLIRNLGPAIARDTKIGRKLEAAARRKAVADANAAAIAREIAQADKLKRLQLALNVPKNPIPSTTRPSSTIKPAVVKPSNPTINLTPKGGAYIGDSARMTSAVPFHLAKGRLPMPAAGNIETDFGAPTKFGGRSKGIKIKTRHGAQITSPTDGVIVYAGKFRAYGQILIIKAGSGYHVLLAGLSRIDVQPGQFVLSSEPVGTMKTAPGKRSGANSPRLYVEFRKNGRPINPRPWWSASSKQKVQG